MWFLRVFIIIGISLIAILPTLVTDEGQNWDPVNFSTPFVKIGSK